MTPNERLGRMIIALATVAGLAGFIANQVIYFETHPTQAPEVYALTTLILVSVVVIGLLGGLLVTHGSQVVRRLPTHMRVRVPARYIVLGLSVGVVVLIVAVTLPMVIAHPATSVPPSGPTLPGGRQSPAPASTAAPAGTPTSTPSGTATPSVSPTPTVSPTPPGASTPSASPTPTAPSQATPPTHNPGASSTPTPGP